MSDLRFAGPARQLLRVRERAATLARAEGILGNEGPAVAVRLVFGFADNGERLAVTLDEAAWKELRQRVERAFYADLPGQMKML